MFGFCPRCETHLDTDRVFGGTIVCHCGWSRPLRESRGWTRLDSTSFYLVLVGVLLVGAFLHAVNWDHHFFAIVPLKLKHYSAKASIQDYEKMASICFERKKLSCEEEAYSMVAKLNPNDIKNLERLGKVQVQLQMPTRAAKTYHHYFTKKGASAEAAYHFAQVLQGQKKYSEAEKYYQFALHAKGNTNEISMARAYIKMLIDTNRLQKAKAEILAVRGQSASANMFMDKEYQALRLKLGEVVQRTVATKAL